jgi:outer membrane protein TolC
VERSLRTSRPETPPRDRLRSARSTGTRFSPTRYCRALIAEALKNNYDVKIAADRVLEQQAQVGITKSAQYPTR